IAVLEKSLIELHKLIPQAKTPPPPPQAIEPKIEKTCASPCPIPLSQETLSEPIKAQAAPLKLTQPTEKPAKPPSPFLILIKENWMGVIGALAVVIGGVFFSLTAEIMQSPWARVGSLLLFSIVLIVVSFKLNEHRNWTLFSSWLTSIAGAIILFVSFGAGGIDGLLCIHHPLQALGFLCFGISVNLFLALRSPSQFVASFHVLLSLATLCMIPQKELLILIGAIVSAAGLIACFRHKWELHLSLIVVTFSVQHTFCYLKIGDSPAYLSIFSSLLVGCTAAMVHYIKAYRYPRFHELPFFTHLLNWGLLGWNLFICAQFNHWAPLSLSGLSAAGFILAQVAKRKKVSWLFYTDTMLSQLIAMIALISLAQFPINPIDIALLISLELILFNAICNLQKNRVLVRFGSILQSISYLPLLVLMGTTEVHDLYFYLRVGAVALIHWGYYLAARLKCFITDAFTFKPSDSLAIVISPTLLVGVIALCIGAFFALDSILIPLLVLLCVFGLALWKKIDSLPELDTALLLFLVILHLIYTTTFIPHASPAIGGLLCLAGLDGILIFGLFLHSRSLKNLLNSITIYGFALNVALATHYFTQDRAPLTAAALYLGYSLIALELSKLNYLKSIGHFLYHVGFLSLLGALTSFILVHLQVHLFWKGLFIRWIMEALALSTVAYWFFFPSKNFTGAAKISEKIHQSLIEIFIGFLTLCIFADCPDKWRAPLWSLLAIIFFQIAYKTFVPKRLYLYSWGYFLASIIHTAFLTHYQTPNHAFSAGIYVPAFIAIALQIMYFVFSFTRQKEIKTSQNIYRLIFHFLSISTLLPIFIGIALIFYFNFEKALLTLSWVGLICVYTMAALVIKSKRAIHISFGALGFCSLRLIAFDLTQQSLSTRACVFIGVGCIMLLISALYKKFKYRLELT
ncbi:MAG: hypothetical protein KDK76_02885, partial [Chlamydiia bacterium]|nr:hypothetical protein [Chlamydiia bacterium]